jgi:hypothetical protein
MYSRAWSANGRRNARNALVKGMVDGNPPYDQRQLDSTAQKYRANFNTGEAEAFLNVAETAFYDLFSEVETFATITVDSEDPDARTWGDVITYHFDWLQRQDDRMDYGVQLSHHDMVLYGSGPQIWDDPLDWRSKAVKHANMLLPEDAPSNVADWERVFFRENYRINDLYQFIADPDAARKAGWNLGAVRDSIMRSAQSQPRFQESGDWEMWQQRLRNNDLDIGDSCARVYCARILYKEFSQDGAKPKISEAWVDLNDSEDRFLYQKQDAYDDMRSAVCAFFYDRGDGTAHSVRGLGVKMFRLLMAKMRLANATFDAAFARAAIMLKAIGNTASQQLALQHLGPYTVLPGGYDFVPTGVPGLVDAPMAVSRDIDNTLESNLGQYRARLEKPQGNPRTAFELQLQASQASTLNKTQISRYYQQLDDWYAERFRRAANKDIPSSTTNEWLKLALEFQKRCTKSGVPRSAIDNAVVKATRVVGQGSAFLRMQMLQQAFSMVFPALPEDGKYNLLSDVISSQVGRQQINRYLPPPQERTGEAQHKWDANIENDTLKNRGQVRLTPTQNDVLHAQEHLAFASQAAQSLQQGADPMEIFGILQASGAHIAAHLQRMSGNKMRSDEFKALNQQFNQLASLTDQLEAQIQEEQERQQQAMFQAEADNAQAAAIAGGSDPKTRIEWAKAQNDARIKEYKAREQMRLRQQKTNQDMALKDARTAQELAQKSAVTRQDLQHKALTTGQDLATKRAKAEQELQQEALTTAQDVLAEPTEEPME